MGENKKHGSICIDFKFIIIVIVIVIIALAIGIGLYYFLYYSSYTSSNEISININGNIANTGELCESHGYIYYSIGNKIFRSDIFGNGTKLIYSKSKTAVKCINIDGNYIFYRNYYDTCLYRINLDGTGEIKVYDKTYIGPICNDKTIYFVVDNGSNKVIYCSDLDGANIKQIYKYTVNQPFNEDINYYNGYIFFLTKDGIERVKFDGSDSKLLVPNNQLSLSDFIVTDNWIFYKGNDMLYSMNLNDGAQQKICDNIGNYNINGNWICYSDLKHKGIYKVQFDGNNIQKLSDDGNQLYLYSIRDYIIYFGFDGKVRSIKISG